MIITRFAPSPTGFLHIGSARTALFNWLYSKKNNGKFYLRIEDTDKARSTQNAINAIIDGLKWLGLNWDGDIVIQSERVDRHIQIVEQLINNGAAYHCYMTKEEIAAIREKNPHNKIISPWRDGNLAPVQNIKPVVRLKSDKTGEIIINDKVQGEVKVSCSELDDMILLRSDQSPTYMMAVVVDDHDMGINHIIRGDDHLSNTFRQLQIYRAMNWSEPQYSHIPLIHGADGAKLSKRHGALGIEYYKDAGYLADALCNYLLRLGWGGNGNVEIVPKYEAIKLFDIAKVSKAPSRFDLAKLNFINSHYISQMDNDILFDDILQRMSKKSEIPINDEIQMRIKKAIPSLKTRASTLENICESAIIYAQRVMPLDGKVLEIIDNIDDKYSISKEVLAQKIMHELSDITEWTEGAIKNKMMNLAEILGLKKSMMQILRAMITGTLGGPGICETIMILGMEESVSRISDFTKAN